MSTERERNIVVTGATGRQGGAVTRALLKEGWKVRALTRNPQSAPARALAALGAEVVQADMDDPASLRGPFQGAHGVYSVQNPFLSGMEKEVSQARNVADIAREAGVQHVVYGSAGYGVRGTGVGSWENKLQAEDYMRGLGLPLTILRPMAFMELMTDPQFYPASSTWHVMPKLLGPKSKVVWIAVEDLGAIAARVFAEPSRFVGQDLKLASEALSLDECRELYRNIFGKAPSRFPMPVWLFQRFVGPDLPTMWRWLSTAKVEEDTHTARAIHPEAMGVEAWLRKQKARAA